MPDSCYSLLKTVRLLCITISVGRSRSVKNVADTKRFSRATSTAMHKKASSKSGRAVTDTYAYA